MPTTAAQTPPRKGARTRAEVGPELRARLNAGVEESQTLVEMLVVDFAQLLRATFPQLPEAVHQKMAAAQELGILGRMQAGGACLFEALGAGALAAASGQRSDIVRGWACYIVPMATADRPLTEALAAIRPLADDPNSGVREWAWLALRPRLLAELPEALTLLAGWTRSERPNLRRYASEALRPRGVWCAHSRELQANPDLGLPLLEPLRADPTKYVQDSVANWLNDASKTQPAWVEGLCARWQRESLTRATERIVQRALRSLRKEKGH